MDSKMINTIQVMLVEDSPEYREVIKPALDDEPDMELNFQFGTAERALDSLKTHKRNVAPDVILLDLHLPGIGGLEAIERLRTAAPKTKIIVLTQSSNESDVVRAISLGASGYLLKSSSLSQITDGIRTVMAGGASIDSNIARFILDTLRNVFVKSEEQDLLTEREMEVLTLLADGYERKEIAKRLEIRNTTISSHVKHIYEKLDVQNAPAAIAKAFRMGLFPPSE